MSLLGKPHHHLTVLSGDDDLDAFTGRTVDELLDQRAVLLGRVLQLETQAIGDQYRGGVLDPREEQVIHDELRSAWTRIAAGLGDHHKYQQMRDIGRGTAPDLIEGEL